MELSHEKARNPYEIGLLSYCIVQGSLSATAPYTPLTETVILAELSGAWHWAWASLWIIGAAVALFGVVNKDVVKGLLYERIGLFALGLGTLGYLAAVVERGDWRSGYGSYVFLSVIAGATGVRWWSIQKAIARTKRITNAELADG